MGCCRFCRLHPWRPRCLHSLCLRTEIAASRWRWRESLLPPIVGARFGVDENAEQFRSLLFKTDFERCGKIVHTGKRQFVSESAMAGDVHPVTNMFHFDVMDVQIVPSSNRAYPIKNVFGERRPGHRTHYYVGIGENPIDSLRNLVRDLP